MQLHASEPADYLDSDAIIETDAPEVVALANELRRANPDNVAFAWAAYEWVRDNVAHSWDAQDPCVTLTASEVLRARVGLCYAKSHLLAALWRAQGIPAGLCYQRLRDGDQYQLHGLVAIYLNDRWHRQDARGNKPGVNAQFSLTQERLAWPVDPTLGEIDYPGIYTATAPVVVATLRSTSDILTLCNGGLPSELP
jgi:transglutaminase-like putative cysteine protease